MNNISIAFLERQLKRALTKALTREIPTLLEFLGRKLTEQEKKQLLKSSLKHPDTNKLSEALTITGIERNSLPDSMIMSYAKKPFAQSRILNWELSKETIEKLIKSSLLNSDIMYASEYAESIGRSLTSAELLLCTEALARNKWPHVDYIPMILQLWGKQRLPAKYRNVIIDKYKKAYHYEGFKTAGGTKRGVNLSWFIKLIDKLINEHNHAEALNIICEEKLFKLPNIPKLFKQIGKDMAHLQIQDVIKRFTEEAPTPLTSQCFAVLILNSQSLPSVFIEKLGFKMDDIALAAFIKNLKTDVKASDRVELRIQELSKIHRKLTTSEGQVVLHYLARSGDYQLFFKIADTHSFKITPLMIRILEKKAH